MAKRTKQTVTAIELDAETLAALEKLDADCTRRERNAAIRARIAAMPCDVCGKTGHREEAHITRG